MVVRKLKAAIYECVLAHSLCNAVTSTGPCGTPFRWGADSVLAQFLRLLSLMPRRPPLAASDIPSRQPKYGASARQVCVRLRRPLGEGRGAWRCLAPKPGCRNTFWIVGEAREPIGIGPRALPRLRTWRWSSSGGRSRFLRTISSINLRRTAHCCRRAARATSIGRTITSRCGVSAINSRTRASNGPAVIRPVSLIPNTLRVPRI